MSAAGVADQSFALRPGQGVLVLHATGFRHPRGHFAAGEAFSGYDELTHLQAGPRFLRIATRRGVFLLRRSAFAERDGPEALVRALIDRVAREPRGAAQLARMAEVEETLRAPSPPRASWVVAASCVLVFALGVSIGPLVQHAGFFNSFLTTHGELWRLVTANLLHGGAIHLAVNTLGLLVLGALVERPLGTTRTVLIVALSALGSTGAGILRDYDALVGASGIVAGLAGAALWLEFRHPERIPASWRIPRWLFLGAIAADALLPLVLPFVAGASHAGGFAAGMLGAALCTGPGLRRSPLRPAAAAGAAALAAVCLASMVAGVRLAARAPGPWARHTARLLTPDAPSGLMNDAAWLMVTAPTPDEATVGAALELAQRAVSATRRRDPNLLDTLAEAQFQAGETASALATIQEAIELAPGVPYFREQERRFRGERSDRPPPPTGPIPPRRPPLRPPPRFEDPGSAI